MRTKQSMQCTTTRCSAQKPTEGMQPCKDKDVKCKRFGKGSHILPIIRSCLRESENWKPIKSKKDYHFPGVYGQHHYSSNLLLYNSDYTLLEQTAENQHYM